MTLVFFRRIDQLRSGLAGKAAGDDSADGANRHAERAADGAKQCSRERPTGCADTDAHCVDDRMVRMLRVFSAGRRFWLRVAHGNSPVSDKFEHEATEGTKASRGSPLSLLSLVG